jgi:hypothetical protein
MLRLALLIELCVLSFTSIHAQLRRFYSLDVPSAYDTVDFTLKATSGISFVRKVDGGNPLTIFGNPNLEKINPSFKTDIDGRTCYADLILDEYRKSMVGDGLVFAMMGGKEEEEQNYWKFLLNDQKVYDLNLSYGIGSSDVDLSGTKVRNLKINTGSADVLVSYSKEEFNQVKMDTFMIKVDLGSIEARDLNFSNAEKVIAEIGFGQGILDFGQKCYSKCDVDAIVGAGKLTIRLPHDTPIIIHMKDSPLCNVSMPKGLEEVEKNVFVNMDYAVYAENLLTFHIEVTMGAIDFELSEN